MRGGSCVVEGRLALITRGEGEPAGAGLRGFPVKAPRRSSTSCGLARRRLAVVERGEGAPARAEREISQGGPSTSSGCAHRRPGELSPFAGTGRARPAGRVRCFAVVRCADGRPLLRPLTISSVGETSRRAPARRTTADHRLAVEAWA